MSEFKGTKRANEYCNSIDSLNPYKAYVDGYNQALKDLKSPEILEMLEELVYQFESNNNSMQEDELLEQAKQLIKQATQPIY